MKSKILVLVFLFLGGIAFAQAPSVNADDSFYEYAQIWEEQGFCERLPSLRPYPLQLVRSILEQVMECENVNAKTKAEEFYNNIFARPIHLFLNFSPTIQIETVSKNSNTNFHFDLDIGAAGSVKIARLFSYAYDAQVTACNNEFILPFASNLPYDAIYDSSTIGKIDMYTDVNMGFGFGTENLYVTGGLYRSGYGPFLNDGFALNDSAYHQANISFAYMQPKWSYVHQISALGATDMTSYLHSVTFGKFMALHAFELNLVKNFSISYYETIMWGKRFDFTYLLPIMFMIGQNVNGARDNLQMGLILKVKPLSWMNWNTDFFVDDFPLNDLFKFNFDSKYRFGLRTGFIFAPTDLFIEKASLTYTMQTPYLFAHWDYEGNTNTYTASTINYQNMTNSGNPIGSTLPPNSDKISLHAKFSPLKDLKILVDLNFIRHANVCEGYTVEEAWAYLSNQNTKGMLTDGSINSIQFYDGTDKGIKSAWDQFSFLTQDSTMCVFQTSINAEYKIALPIKLSIFLSASYTFEYLKNAGVDRSIWNYNEEYTKRVYTDEEKIKAVQDARNEWRAALYDVIKNYFSFSVKVMW